MSNRVFATSSRFLSRRSPILVARSLIHMSTINTGIFEPMPREELVTKFKSRLRGRQFLPGALEGGFPEFLEEPRESFPLGMRVLNSNQSSLAELATKCMQYVENNLSHNPAILFRGLPAKTAEDFSIIAQVIQGQTLTFKGGLGYRAQVDEKVGTYTASEHPKPYSIDLHNEMSFNDIFPSKVSRHVERGINYSILDVFSRRIHHFTCQQFTNLVKEEMFPGENVQTCKPAVGKNLKLNLPSLPDTPFFHIKPYSFQFFLLCKMCLYLKKKREKNETFTKTTLVKKENRILLP